MARDKSKLKLEIGVQDTIVEKSVFEVDPHRVLVNGVLLEEVWFQYQRSLNRTGVIR